MDNFVKRPPVIDNSCTNRSDGVIRVLTRPFYRFRGVATEASAAFRADDGGESSRLIRRESVNDDIFNPVSMITRTAAVSVPIARPCEWFVRLRLQWFLAHLANPQIIRTL